MLKFRKKYGCFLPFPLTGADGGIVHHYEREKARPGFVQRVREKSFAIICQSAGKKSPEVLMQGGLASQCNATGRVGPPSLLHSMRHIRFESEKEVTFLGEDSAGRSLFAVAPAQVDEEYLSKGSWVSVRDAFSFMDGTDLNVVGLAVTMEQWRSETKFCCACGSALLSSHFEGDHYCCGKCKRLVYPVLKPAVIITVLDGKGCVLLSQLKRKPTDPNGKLLLTILAGFVSAGESLEEAVMREVAEESGARISSLTYVGSQPYPFPGQMMACYFGLAGDAADIRPEEDELHLVRWVKKDEVALALRGEHPEFSLPPCYTATTTMLRFWCDGVVSNDGKILEGEMNRCSRL